MAYSSDLSDAEWEIVELLLLELQPIKGLRDTVVNPLALIPLKSSLGNTIFLYPLIREQAVTPLTKLSNGRGILVQKINLPQGAVDKPMAVFAAITFR